jgi:hypothetical protein
MTVKIKSVWSYGMDHRVVWYIGIDVSEGHTASFFISTLWMEAAGFRT